MKTCIDITIWDYISAYYHKDLSCFDGTQEQKELNLAAIIEEFSVLTDNPSYYRLLTVLNDINAIMVKLLQTEVSVTVLTLKYSPEHVAILNSLGYAVDFDPKDRNGWKSDIEKINRVVKNYKLQLEILKDKLEKIKTDAQTGNTDDEKSFVQSVIVCGMNLEIKIGLKETSMYELAAYIRSSKNIKQKNGKESIN